MTKSPSPRTAIGRRLAALARTAMARPLASSPSVRSRVMWRGSTIRPPNSACRLASRSRMAGARGREGAKSTQISPGRPARLLEGGPMQRLDVFEPSLARIHKDGDREPDPATETDARWSAEEINAGGGHARDVRVEADRWYRSRHPRSVVCRGARPSFRGCDRPARSYRLGNRRADPRRTYQRASAVPRAEPPRSRATT
jgi:hypothetical protein